VVVAYGVEQWVRGEEDEFVGEDCPPDYCCEDPDAGLRDGSSAYPQVVVKRLALHLTGISSSA